MNYTLITGASSGLGKALAKLYAKANNNLLLIGSNMDRLNLAKAEILEVNNNIIIECLEADLSEISECKKVYNYTLEKDYFINNLVNAAGFGDQKDFKDMDINLQIKMNHVNCDALLYFTRVFLENMLKYNEGHIINVASIAGFVPGPYMVTYHASKSYVLNLGEGIAHELKGTNVHLLTLCPGPFLSGFTSVAHNDYTFKKIKPITSEQVASYAYKMSLKGKTMKVVSFKNKLTCFAPRFFPRKFVAAMSAANIKPKNK